MGITKQTLKDEEIFKFLNYYLIWVIISINSEKKQDAKVFQQRKNQVSIKKCTNG